MERLAASMAGSDPSVATRMFMDSSTICLLALRSPATPRLRTAMEHSSLCRAWFAERRRRLVPTHGDNGHAQMLQAVGRIAREPVIDESHTHPFFRMDITDLLLATFRMRSTLRGHQVIMSFPTTGREAAVPGSSAAPGTIPKRGGSVDRIGITVGRGQATAPDRRDCRCFLGTHAI
jgi:hypothetical protein